MPGVAILGILVGSFAGDRDARCCNTWDPSGHTWTLEVVVIGLGWADHWTPGI